MQDNRSAYMIVPLIFDGPVRVGGRHLARQRLGEAVRDGGNRVTVHLDAVEENVTVVEVLAKCCVADAG